MEVGIFHFAWCLDDCLSFFSFLLFNRFTNVLLQQERMHIDNTLTTVSSRLSGYSSPLNKSDVDRYLQPSISNGDQDTTGSQSSSTSDNIYSDSLIVNFSRDNIVVNVYGVNKQQLFESRADPVKFQASEKRKIMPTKHNGKKRCWWESNP